MIAENLKTNKINMIFGTHALFQKRIIFKNLGFIIIDDYGCYKGCAKAVDEFREINNINDFMVTIRNERYWIKTK